MKFIFLTTHLGSGSKHLCESLNRLPTICCTCTGRTYSHPTDLASLKLKDRYAKIFIDTLEFNYSLASTAFYDCTSFIYLIRNPKNSLGEVIKEGYSPKAAMSYYLFRLRRMYEMAHRTPDSLFLTYEDLNADLLSDFLGVKVPSLLLSETKSEPCDESGYEKYLNMFRSLHPL